jgi:hypothetical protein
MKFLSNHSFFGYSLALCLAIVLSISPIQNISASVSSCTEMADSSHHNMNGSSDTGTTHHTPVLNKADTNQANNSLDCCSESECQTTHCAGTTAAVFISNTLSHHTYVDSNIYQMPDISVTHFYSSSLYRPPKV